jgi:toxin ParE1/3/4
VRLVRLTEPAIKDLEEIYDYIANDNIEAAERLKARLQKRWRAAAENPGIGRKRDQWQPNLRSTREGNYLILYLQIEDGIEIVRVVHGAREIEALFDA